MDIKTEFFWATECQLATLGGLLCKKSSPKSEIQRQRTISLRMLLACQSLWSEMQGKDFIAREHPRVNAILFDHLSVEDGLDRWIASVKHRA